MRDPKRIRPLLARLAQLWEEHPDQRFGQLLMNLSRHPYGGVTPDGTFQDVWEWDVAEYEQAMRRFALLRRIEKQESAS